MREPQAGVIAGVRLRPTGRYDLAFVTALERRSDHLEAIGQWTDEEHVAAIAGREEREHWIIERDGVRAGYLIAYRGEPHYPGIYVKRILVADKDQGTGQAALAAYLDDAFARRDVEFVWLTVRIHNERAQAVYRKLGFEWYDPPEETAAVLARAGDVSVPIARRMRIERTAWTATRRGRSRPS